MIVVADTGPVNYLILSGHIDLLRQIVTISYSPNGGTS